MDEPVSELPVREDERSQESPDVENGGGPLGADPDPHRDPSDADELRALRAGAAPPGQQHGGVHAGEREYQMEERVRVADRPRFLPLPFFCVARRQKGPPCPWTTAMASLSRIIGQSKARKSESSHSRLKI